jgi:hypothetical protein
MSALAKLPDDVRIGVSPSVHRVLDLLENLQEGPLNRAPLDAVLAEIDLAGDTVFTAAFDDEGVIAATRADPALAMPAAYRMAALLLLGIERAALGSTAK